MAGNENSGRRKIYEEWNKVSAINKLWEKVNRKVMAGEDLTEFEEKLVVSILPKTIKTETDITSDGKPMPILNIKSNVIQSEDHLSSSISIPRKINSILKSMLTKKILSLTKINSILLHKDVQSV